jgi:hypothetical protein
VICSLIFGRLRAYWLQNTYQSDFYVMAVLLTHRLMARGYSFLILKPLFEEASKNPAKPTACDTLPTNGPK